MYKKVIFVNQSYLWQAVALASASEVAFLHHTVWLAVICRFCMDSERIFSLVGLVFNTMSQTKEVK
jgi:hypothetical protein